MAFFEEKNGAIVTMRSDVLRSHHGFTTRFGGVSEGEFASLNLGSSRGDDQSRVGENYRRVCELALVGGNDAVVTCQVHGIEVRSVTAADKHAVGSRTPYEADGIVTSEKNLPLMCFAADCIPVLLEDTQHGVIGAVHCGWRSSVGDILRVAVEKMCALGAKPGCISAALGPAIGACCFETDEDVVLAVKHYLGEKAAEGTFTQRADGKYLVDLREANRRRLVQLGVRAEQIDVSEECTMCSHEKYWSHRYTRGRRGTQGAFIVLR